MKKQKVLKTTACVLALAASMGVGAVAGANNKEIAALLCYDVKLKYNMEEQILKDANGKRVYPLNYEGSTYLPVRAVGELLGVNVGWDDATRSVLLGRTGEIYDFLEILTPVICKGEYKKKADGKPLTLGNKTYDNYLKYYTYKGSSNCVSYDLEGKFETVTLHIYCERNNSFDIVGDNEELLYTVDIVGGSIPKEIKVDVHGTSQFKFITNNNTNNIIGECVYIVDATIE